MFTRRIFSFDGHEQHNGQHFVVVGASKISSGQAHALICDDMHRMAVAQFKIQMQRMPAAFPFSLAQEVA